MSKAQRPPNRLWIERYAEASGCTWLAGRLFGDADGGDLARRRGPYLFVLAVWLVVAIGFPTVTFLRRGRFPVLETPGNLFLLPVGLVVVFVILRLRDRHALVVDRLPDPIASGEVEHSCRTRRLLGALGWPAPETAIDEVVPSRTKRGLLVLGLGLHASWFFVDPDPMSHFIAVHGWAISLVFFLLIVPLVSYVIGMELASLYIGALLLLPLKVTVTRRIDFTDPMRFGGLRPLGTLLRDATVSLLVLVALFGVFEVVAAGTDPLDPYSRIILFGGMAFAAAAFFVPVYWLHKFMRTSKEARIAAIIEEVRESGPDDHAFPDTRPIDPTDYDEYTSQFIRLTWVENTREFPVDFSLVLEFVLVLVLPYLAHISSIFVFEELLH